MILDIIAATLIIAMFIRGYRKGIIIAVFSLLSIMLGVVCALKLSHILADFLARKGIVTSAWAPIISYVLLFILVVWLVRMGASLIEKSVDALALGLINRLIGGVLYVGLAAVLWSSILWLTNQAHLITPETINKSVTYKYFLPVAPWVFDHIGTVLPFAKGLFADLQHFFDHVNTKLPQHVGTH